MIQMFYLQCVSTGMSLYTLLSSNPLHLQLLGRNIMKSSLNTCKQLLTSSNCILQLLPSNITLLLQVLQPCCLQLCCRLLARKAFYQHLDILGCPGDHLGKEQGVVGVWWGDLGFGTTV